MKYDLLIKAGAATVAAYAGWRYIDNNFHVASDIRYMKKFMGFGKMLMEATKENMNVVDFWRQAVKKWGENESIVFEDRVYTYNQVDIESVCEHTEAQVPCNRLFRNLI